MQLEALTESFRDRLLTPTLLYVYHEGNGVNGLSLYCYLMTRLFQEFSLYRESSEVEAGQHFRMTDFD